MVPSATITGKPLIESDGVEGTTGTVWAALRWLPRRTPLLHRTITTETSHVWVDRATSCGWPDTISKPANSCRRSPASRAAGSSWAPQQRILHCTGEHRDIFPGVGQQFPRSTL